MYAGEAPIFRNRQLLGLIADEPADKHFPFHLRLDLTEVCNCACSFCGWQNPDRSEQVHDEIDLNFNGKTQASADWVERLISKFAEMGGKAVSFTGSGDPLVAPIIRGVLEQLNGLGIEYGITSNFAMKLNDRTMELLAKSSWLRCSRNAGSPEVYNSTQMPREVDAEIAFENVHNNLRRLIELRGAAPAPIVTASFVICETNATDIWNAARLCRDMEIDGILFRPELKPSRTHILENVSYSDEVRDQLGKSKRDFANADFTIHSNENREIDNLVTGDSKLVCRYINHSTMVAANGDLYPCCYTHGRPEFRVGNVNEASLKELWFSDKRIADYSVMTVDRCPPCPYTDVNRALEKLYAGEVGAEALQNTKGRETPFV